MSEQKPQVVAQPLPDGYYVYRDGRVYSSRSRRFLTPLRTNGYLHVVLCGAGGKKRIAIHALVARAFLMPMDGRPYVNHKNGVRTDNRVENLEWCSQSENVQHAYDTGLRTVDEAHRARAAELGRKKRKLSDEQVDEIRRTFTGARGQITALSNKYQIDRKSISSIIKGQAHV